MADAIAHITDLERPIQEEDASGKCVLEIVLRRIQDALSICAEATEGYSEREGEVIGGRLEIVDGLVVGQRIARRSIDRALGPFLGIAPGGRTGLLELDGGLAVGFVLSIGTVNCRKYLFR